MAASGRKPACKVRTLRHSNLWRARNPSAEGTRTGPKPMPQSMVQRSTDVPQPLRLPDARGDGAPLNSAAADLSRKAGILVDEETGVRFESLVLFAEPLFDHYELDPSEAFSLRLDVAAADEAIVTALEAARVLWAHFSLSPAQREELHGVLVEYLLGPGHTPEDEVDLEILLARMEEQWSLLTPEDRAIAEDLPQPTLGFEELMEHPYFVHGQDLPSAAGYGPDQLSELEAQALFAQPLMDSANDADEMEEAMERAHAYWELAHNPPREREGHMQDVIDSLGGSHRRRAEVEREAREMLARFDELFPGHGA
jgi:hypothetical protein